MEHIEWHAPEYIHTVKTSDWYWIVGIVTISITLICIILNNAIFGILILVSAATLSLYASRKPDTVLMRADARGIYIGSLHYPYSTLESFWIEMRERHPRIIIKSKKRFAPFVTMLLDETDPEPVHAFLSKHLHEEEHIEPFLEKLLIHLGF